MILRYNFPGWDRQAYVGIIVGHLGNMITRYTELIWSLVLSPLIRVSSSSMGKCRNYLHVKVQPSFFMLVIFFNLFLVLLKSTKKVSSDSASLVYVSHAGNSSNKYSEELCFTIPTFLVCGWPLLNIFLFLYVSYQAFIVALPQNQTYNSFEVMLIYHKTNSSWVFDIRFMCHSIVYFLFLGQWGFWQLKRAWAYLNTVSELGLWDRFVQKTQGHSWDFVLIRVLLIVKLW